MKWIFLAGLMILVPTLVALLRGQPRLLPPLAFAIGLTPFLIAPFHLYAAPISWAYWQGPVKGVEVTLLDAIAIAVLFVTRPVRFPRGPKIGLGVIGIAVLISSLAAGTLFPCFFYAWQLARAALLTVAVARLTASSKEAPVAILTGVGAGVVAAALSATWAHLHGAVQTGGFLGHQNTLGIISHFASIPAFALLLAKRRTGLALVILAAEVLILYAGGSRGTIGLFAIGMVICAGLSLRHRKSGRKAAILAGFAVLGLVAAPVMLAAIERRPQDEIASSNAEREAFKAAARLIIADHPLGIGADRYVLVANIGGYSDKAGVPWNNTEREAPVHNSWLLITAELGYLGLIGFLILVGSCAVYGIRALSRIEHGERADLLVGITTALIVVALHSCFEWITMTYLVHYFFAMAAGMLFGLAGTAEARGVARRNRSGPRPALARPESVPA